MYLTASIGISVTPEGGHDAETLRRSADLAMYRAKSRKAGWAVFEPSLNRHSYERFQLAAYLRRAAEKNELEVHYQPQVRLKDQVVVGLEALLRWKHPHLGLVPPAQFIPVAEETGLDRLDRGLGAARGVPPGRAVAQRGPHAGSAGRQRLGPSVRARGLRGAGRSSACAKPAFPASFSNSNSPSDW